MSGCCRIDPIHHGGIYIPLLAPRLSLPPFASLFPSSFPSDVRLELTSRTIAGVVSPVRPLMPPLSWGRLRKLPFPFPSLPAVAPSLQLPGPPRYLLLSVVSLEDATAIVYASNLLTPGAMTLHPSERSAERSFTRFLELLIVRSRANSTTGDVLEKTAAFVGRERTAIEGDLPACELRLPFEVFAFIRTRDFPRCFISRYL